MASAYCTYCRMTCQMNFIREWKDYKGRTWNEFRCSGCGTIHQHDVFWKGPKEE